MRLITLVECEKRRSCIHSSAERAIALTQLSFVPRAVLIRFMNNLLIATQKNFQFDNDEAEEAQEMLANHEPKRHSPITIREKALKANNEHNEVSRFKLINNCRNFPRHQQWRNALKNVSQARRFISYRRINSIDEIREDFSFKGNGNPIKSFIEEIIEICPGCWGMKRKQNDI